MIRILIFLALVFVNAAPAAAGRRCGRTYQTYASGHGWGQSCYACHKQKASAYNWREAITTIEKQKIETAAFLQALGSVSGRGNAAVYGSPGGVSIEGQISSYPVQGQSLYGVQSYATHPLIDLNAAFNTQGKLAAQLSAGAQATAQDAADLTSLAYQLESNRQTQIAAFNAIQAVAQGPAPQPVAQSMVFRATSGPNGVVIEPVPQGQEAAGPAANPGGLAVLEASCASCHSGANVQGRFDLAKIDQLSVSNWDDLLERLDLPPEDPKAMPRAKTAEGFGPGVKLTRREIHAIEDLAWGGR